MLGASTLVTALLNLCAGLHTVPTSLILDSAALNGMWTVKNANRSIRAKAVVPGGIYTDLLAAGVLSGDIYYRFNDMEYRWVSRDNWTYTCQFQVPAELKMKKEIFLVLHGVDTIASIYLNKRLIGYCDNMFVRYSFLVKSLIENGVNQLDVVFKSAITAAEKRYMKQAQNYIVPPKCVPPSYKGECHVNHLRKMQASFSWDWGPAFPSAGLWKSVVLEAFDNAVLRQVTTKAREMKNYWLLEVEVFLETGQQTARVRGNFQAKLHLKSGSLGVSRHATLTPAEPGQFQKTLVMKIPKSKIELWWPNGLGDQKLYNLTVTFRDDSGNNQGQVSLRIGFRTLQLVQEPVGLGLGLTFYFKVNNVSLFAKGSNWIPSHVLPEKSADPATIYHLLSSCKTAHMNMLRVWGGGLYESDLFYQLADEMGILIWQDFMFACNMYPTSPEFLQSVKTEVIQQVHRLQHHPSIAIWAGNNENEAALQGGWYATSQNFSLYKADYVKLYVNTIRNTFLTLNTSLPFVTSSPSNGLETERAGYVASNPYSSLYGDIHYYNYNSNGWNPNIYPVTRFSSEYGYQSLPSLQTLANISEPSDLSTKSDFFYHRQHLPNGNLIMENLITSQFKLPTFEDKQEELRVFIYLTQIYQAMAVKTETECNLRARSMLTEDGKGLTMGALYWQLNDIWQAPSWASIEFGGRWKMLHFFACNFFAPMLMSPTVTAAGNLEVHLMSDLLLDEQSILTISVYRWDSLTPIHENSSEYTLHKESVSKVFDHDLKDYLHSAGCGRKADRRCFLYFSLTNIKGKKISPDNFLFPCSLKRRTDVKAANTFVKTVEYDIKTNTFKVEIKTDGVALFVWLETKNIVGHFSENGFLMVKPSRTIQFVSKQSTKISELKEDITITYLADTVLLTNY